MDALRRLESHFDEDQRVLVLGQRTVGTTSHLRFLAAAACLYVRVHVQHDGVGGGGSSYNAATFVSSTRVNCGTNRQQDVTVTRNGTDHYYVWLVPEFGYVNGDFVKYNGAEAGDQMAYADLGV